MFCCKPFRGLTGRSGVDYHLAMIRVAILVICMIVFAGGLACAALGADDDCCNPATCSLCAQSAVIDQTTPLLAPTVTFTTIHVEFLKPSAPDLARLSPPPNCLA